MNVLVINSGSSSIKYRLYEMPEGRELAVGLVERIGEPGARVVHRWQTADETSSERIEEDGLSDHAAGFQLAGRVMRETMGDAVAIDAIGHRVVHGGEKFSAPTRIDTKVLETIRGLTPLAPLHNPANVKGIEVTLEAFPDTPQVAVFDTAYHQTMPARAYLYAVPAEWYREHGVRRYGFHGTSHHYVAKRAAAFFGKALEELNLITIHLGNGASAAAIEAGRSVDTTMGLTPLEGLVMGTRCGDIDPAIPFHVSRSGGVSIEAVEAALNRESGLKGLCGENDMRSVLAKVESGDDRARAALEVYTYRIRKVIGAFAAVLGRVDAVVFTAGIGENSAEVRARSCAELEALGIELDAAANETGSGDAFGIHTEGSRVAILVVATNEELEIATAAFELVNERN